MRAVRLFLTTSTSSTGTSTRVQSKQTKLSQRRLRVKRENVEMDIISIFFGFNVNA